jgi:hypothetical protein
MANISVSEARFIAHDWHSGQFSAFYAFQGTGYFEKYAMIRECKAELEHTYNDDLMDLLQFCEDQPDPIEHAACDGSGCDDCDFTGYTKIDVYLD